MWGTADGTQIVQAAAIYGFVDGTPGTNVMLGRLCFWTTAAGAGAPSERMRISANGNVGIGYSAPEQRLHVQTSINSIGTIQLGGSATTGYYSQLSQNGNVLSFIANGDQAYRVGLSTNNGSGYITFQTAINAIGNTERMRITPSGNVLIGTTTDGEINYKFLET